MEEIYTVERHDDEYHGPHSTTFAKSLETALMLAENHREQHRSDEWRLVTDVGDEEKIMFAATNSAGWVTIDKAPLHE